VSRKPAVPQHPKINEMVVPILKNMGGDKQLMALATAKKGTIDAAIITFGVNKAFK